MANTRRIPFVLNLDDPLDAALWQALEPMLARHRASQFIRGAVAYALGIGGLLQPTMSLPTLPSLPAGEPVKAKRPKPGQPKEIAPPLPVEDNEDDLAAATDSFLNAFG